MELVPKHLQNYIVEQDYSRYTAVDHAVWRYILRQLRAFLADNAHECYLEGLERTGILTDRIPSISEISEKLNQFGWRALPVSGFIPPAAFMELQSLGILPIASDMRTLEHLEYTPAPDIVHEAAGHAPILIHPEFSDYLKKYAQVAKYAIISREDLDLYEAIRNLSDIKEHPNSTLEEISAAQLRLDQVSKSMSHVSEASELGRMNWWTAEYGLIGSLEDPKIFGAGLLSSVGESKWCLSTKVKKIPLTVDCIRQTYDITEPQPQLFVAPDFKTLASVLEEMARKMAFRTGGLQGIQKALLAKTTNTVQLNSHVQVSGQLNSVKSSGGDQPEYIQFVGPCQICFDRAELPQQGKKEHSQGFGSPIGRWKKDPTSCPSKFSDETLIKFGIQQNKIARLEFTSGIVVEGKVVSFLRKENHLILITWSDCKVTAGTEVLFSPDWGSFDMLVGSEVTSVFGGPADRTAFGEIDTFVAKRVPPKKWTPIESLRISHYQKLRDLRENEIELTTKELEHLMLLHSEKFPMDWLFFLEVFEIALAQPRWSALRTSAERHLDFVGARSPKMKTNIQEGVSLAKRK